MYKPSGNADIAKTEIERFVSADEEAAMAIGQDSDVIACYIGSLVDMAVNGSLLPSAFERLQEELDELVQTCADDGSDPSEGSRINNEGIPTQLSYIFAYNGLRDGTEVVQDALEGILPEHVLFPNVRAAVPSA